MQRGLSRRKILGIGAAAGSALLATRSTLASRTYPERQDTGEVVIDLAVEPATLDPALVYEVDGWSIVHSIYDALVQLGPRGSLQMVLAESVTQTDPLIWEIRLRPNILFHNDEPLDSSAIAFSIAHILDPETKSQVAGNFQVIERVEEVDELTARLHLSVPAPWLPSQMAPWLPLLPPKYAADPGNDFAANPVGTGPYRFVRWDRGSQVVLERNDDYAAASAKGKPIAANVTFRFVPDATTRVTDIISGTSQIARSVPFDQIEAVDAAADVIAQPISGCAFIRIPTDVAPFDDPRVRVALNHAVDVDAIIQSLLGGNGVRLANFFVPDGLGYDKTLAPFAYDPERAKKLLADAGYSNGFSTHLAYTPGDVGDPVNAIAGQLAAVGVTVDVQSVELATFNSTWKDPNAAPLRMLTWRPLDDPFTLLNLVVSKDGYLSRYDDPRAQALLDAGAIETDPEKRNQTYRELGKALYDSPAAIYLWRLTSFYGVSQGSPAWTPRPDDWILPLVTQP